MLDIDLLASIIPPPPQPSHPPTSACWLKVFDHFGTRLPEDFVQFHKLYGSGHFASRSHKWSASVSSYDPIQTGFNPNHQFCKSVPGRLSFLRLHKERFPKRVPLPLYWEPGGFLPWGTTTNGTDLGWLVSGDLVDNWKVAALRTAKGECEIFDMSMCVFLANIISGKTTCPLMPTGFPGEKGVVWSSFLPGT